MPISPAFTVSQSGLTPDTITVTDTSTGSDAAIDKRWIYFQTSDGTYLVADGTTTDYELWAYANATQSFDVLPTDHALAITVKWMSAADAVLYELTQLYCFPQYNKNFFYYLIQQQAVTPRVLQNNIYFSNMAALWMNIRGAIQAVEDGADIDASQECLDRATYMQQNENFNF